MSGPEVREPSKSGQAWWVFPLWGVAAFLSAVCGIGGGLFAVPVLHYLGHLDIKRSVGTSLILVFLLSLTGTLVELSHAQSALDGKIVALLIVGGWLGARLGFRFAQRADARRIKAAFAALLLLSALRVLMLDSSALSGSPADSSAFTWLEDAIVVAVGLCGGFVAPLLGVGGGLIVIPALFLSLPNISYLEARACSTALSVFTSGQSSALHWRAGNVEVRMAARLSLWTVGAAALGVLAVHRPGWVQVARVVMALVLIFVGLRFALDVRRAGAAAPQRAA